MTSKNITSHAVFGMSAAGSVRTALQIAGSDEPVFGLADNFSFGPIDSDDPASRVEWVENVLGYDGWGEVVSQSEDFLAGCRSAQKLNAWVCLKEASTYAGYLWWLSKIGDIPCDVTKVPRLSTYPPEELVPWLDRSVQHRLAQWRALQADNAGLRIIEGDNLVSRPLDWFDDFTLGFVTREWQRMARIVGEALARSVHDHVYQVGDLLLSARLADLAEAGILEWRGEALEMGKCELRLAF